MNFLNVVSQAVPVPGLSIAVSLVTAIWTDVQTVQSNKTQCTRLAERAMTVVEGVKHEVASQGVLSDAMQRNIAELESALEDIDAFVRSLAQKSFFRRFINKGDIDDHIVDLNRRLQTCCELFSMRAAIDVQAWTVQDQRDREADMSELRMLLGRALKNDEVLWRTMQLQTDQLLDALNALHRRLDEFPGGTVERGFAEAGVAVLQHMSGQQPGPKADWEISAFDVEWDETPLAAGAFGTVHRGLWRRTQVAIKFLPKETRHEVLLNEVKIWRSLSHPHVHRFLGCCVTGTPFLVSELCAHGSAVQFLRKRPHSNRPRLVYQVALGMDHLHTKGVLHGDLKASNVLIDEGGNARITDFGLSRVYMDINAVAARQVPVAPAAARWTAPEMLQGGHITRQVDVYAWGMTAYEIFTGKVPFGNVFDVYSHVVTRRQSVSRPSYAEAPQLGNEVWGLMLDAVAWEPLGRPLFSSIAQRMSSIVRTPSPEPLILPQFQLSQGTQVSRQGQSAKPVLPVFEYPYRYSIWSGPKANDTMSYVECSVSHFNLHNPFTVTVWARRGGVKVKAADPTYSRCILSLECKSDTITSLLSVGLAPGNGPICASLRPHKTDGDYSTSLQCKTQMPAYAQPRPAWLQTMWVHIALVCDNQDVRLFMNGVEEATGRMNRFEERRDVRLVLGRGLQSGKMCHQWDGMIEGAKIFQAALSPGDIKAEMTITKPSLEGSGYLVQPFGMP